jgi:hypothetical protein
VRAPPLTVTRSAKSLVQTEVKKSDMKRANDGVDAGCFDVWRHMNGCLGYTCDAFGNVVQGIVADLTLSLTSRRHHVLILSSRGMVTALWYWRIRSHNGSPGTYRMRCPKHR